jgi:hypothetical protein
MKRKFFYIFITVAFAAFSAACAARTEAEPDWEKETVPAAELVRQADELYAERENLDKLRDALALLKRARRADSNNFEAAWKLAQASYFLGKYTTDEKESEKAFAEGINAARIAVRLNPEKPDGHFWLGANLGGEAEKSPFTKGVTAIGEIRSAMQKVIEIDPSYKAAAAYDALAQIELKGGFAGGKAEKALEYLEKGFSLNRQNPYFYLHLAEANLALKRTAEAKKNLDELLKMQPAPEFLPEFRDAERQAKKLLEKKF